MTIINCIQVHPSTSKYIQVYPSTSRCIQVYPSLFKSIQVYPSLSKSIQVCPSLSKSIQVYPSLSKSIQIYPSQSNSNFYLYIGVWTSITVLCIHTLPFGQVCSMTEFFSSNLVFIYFIAPTLLLTRSLAQSIIC